MALSENYRTETIGRSDCRPIVRLSADTIVRWDYRPNPNIDLTNNTDFECIVSEFAKLKSRKSSLPVDTYAVISVT